MFDNPNDPKSLLKSLELLCTSGIVGPQNWCGIDRDKLDESEIPEPLKDLYAFSGATLGDNEWCSPFSYEDHLVTFELLTIDDGKLVFAYENQGCWHAGTETGGEDPTVWLREPDENWNQTPCKSRLSMFLVIMVLRELIFGSRYQGSSSKLLGKFRKKKLHVAPLLLDAPFAFGSHSFHIVNANILVMDDSYCATNSTEYFEKFPKLFKDRILENRPEKEYTSHEEMIRNRSAPWPLREGVARLQSQFHQQRAEYHSAKAAMFRQMLTDLQQNRPNNGNFF